MSRFRRKGVGAPHETLLVAVADHYQRGNGVIGMAGHSKQKTVTGGRRCNGSTAY